MQGAKLSEARRVAPSALSAIKAGQFDFTIDQEPYLQGFLPAPYLYLFNLSGGLVAPPDTDTGRTFVTKATVDTNLVPAGSRDRPRRRR